MKLGRVVLAWGLVGAIACALAQGCQDPTQVTLALSLDKKARCEEINAGTAITVGVEPADTENRVATGFVTARTNACDDSTGQIGTLVVTPRDDGSRASLVVVVGYKGNDPTRCKPPLYQGCIVARRRFAFAEHTRLTMPIVIDPDCADVPCDAFSTCSKGVCFNSDTTCAGGACERPGVLDDGGVDEAGQVIPDASGFDSAVSDAPSTTTFCGNGNTLVCNSTSCTLSGPMCCLAPSPQCAALCNATDQACCQHGAAAECQPGLVCNRPAGAAFGRCEASSVDAGDAGDGGSSIVTCNGNVLQCGSGTCAAPAKCCGTSNSLVCSPASCSVNDTQYCCTPADCRARADGGTPLCLVTADNEPDFPLPPKVPKAPNPVGVIGICVR
ncbi:MAG: repeat domain protein [Labilithrix sp.]|nr:repeat domain protein [Labilithrix sp.]